MSSRLMQGQLAELQEEMCEQTGLLTSSESGRQRLIDELQSLKVGSRLQADVDCCDVQCW